MSNKPGIKNWPKFEYLIVCCEMKMAMAWDDNPVWLMNDEMFRMIISPRNGSLSELELLGHPVEITPGVPFGNIALRSGNRVVVSEV